MVFGIAGCSQSDTNLICDCYKETESIIEPSGYVEGECSDGPGGLIRESLVFNERNHSISWKDTKHVGSGKNSKWK